MCVFLQVLLVAVTSWFSGPDGVCHTGGVVTAGWLRVRKVIPLVVIVSKM